MTLSLNRVAKGYYENNVGVIRISLNNPYIYLGEGSNSWQLTIEVDGDELVSEYFDTKKQASTFGAQFINSL
tara:strand:- start:744 stop:959 length:216 start_codon:yes stop_codon:yes gene_type:complete